MLPSIEMDGYLTGVLVTPGLEMADWVGGRWDKRPDLRKDALMDAMMGVVIRRTAIEVELEKGWPE